VVSYRIDRAFSCINELCTVTCNCRLSWRHIIGFKASSSAVGKCICQRLCGSCIKCML